MSKPSVCLNMIVKNESHIIESTLKNLLNYIHFDYWVICDTGSTDNTPTIIENFFRERGIFGEVVHHEWKDFAHNRSLALECAFNKTDYVFIFDADDSIHGTFSLPTPMNVDCYQLQFGTGIKYIRPLLFTNRKRWRYRGVLHEFLEPIDTMNGTLTLVGNYYVESGRTGNRSMQPDKYYKDAIVLQNAYEIEPPDKLKGRYAFYCAQSYRDAGPAYIDNSVEWYTKVLDFKNHWNQELYFSALQLGDLYKRKNDMTQALFYYLKTVEYDSERMEGIVSAVQQFYHAENHIIVNALYHKFKNYSRQVIQKLFVNLYFFNDRLEFYNSISAFYVNDKSSGYHCCKHILTNRRVEHHDLDVTAHNLIKFYTTELNEDKDTLSLFYELNKIAQPWSESILQLWNVLFEKNREKLTTVTPSILKSVQHIAQQSFLRSQKKDNQEKIMITFTTCKRLDLFKETMHSILLHWKDIDAITHWYCVDDNSSGADRKYMQKQYPWVQFYMKKETEKGHCKSMNIIWNTLQTVQPKYWIHMEDDFLFYQPIHYIKPYLQVLNQNDYGIKQIVYNRNYAETVENYAIQGHVATTIPNIVLHVHPEPEHDQYVNCHYWPHYSFRPSICLVEPILQLGKYNLESKFFEKEYAHRWTNANYKTAFYDGITHRHIGRLTSEIGKVKNAYDLNEECQFGNQPYFKIVNLERRPDRKQNVEAQLHKESIHPSWVRAVDGLTVEPTYAIKQLFLNNDFGSKRGVIGCALSHYQLWQHLVKDQVHDFYVIMEDDITLCEGFKQKINNVISTIKNTGFPDLLFLGYHMFSNKREKVKDIYDVLSESTVHPLCQELYIGGTFAYIIHKTGAEKLLDYSAIHGIQHGIDYFMVKRVPNLNIQELQPCIVHSPWCEFADQNVDTDIQLCTDNLFADYDQFEFIPKLDCIGNDIEYKSGSITTILKHALANPKCVAVNTLGFFKHSMGALVPSNYFKDHDGLFVKKIKECTKECTKECIETNKYRVKMLCNWCSSEQLCKDWSNMYDSRSNFVMTHENTNIDYYVVINSTQEFYEPYKTIVFQMEPWVHSSSPWGVKTWGEWAIPDPSIFLAVRGRHSNCHNNVFWQLELSYAELEKPCTMTKQNRVSTICSSKYFDPGHIDRIELIKFLDNKSCIDIYNQDNQFQFTNYKGSCTPYLDKSRGIMSYKYYFMIENNYEDNFITEKLWEPILCETLCFYYGCPNANTYIDSRAFVVLPIHDFDLCYEIIQTAIREDWWSQRLPFIKIEKQKILQELSFCPVVNQIIHQNQQNQQKK